MGRLAIVAPTNFDARVTMVEGDSGILRVCPPWNKPTYHPSKSEVHWPNGAIATLFSSEEPDRLNGPQFDGALLDELGVWKNVRHTWDMLSFGLRLGKRPRRLVATTPKPYPESRALLRELLADPSVAVTRGSSYENVANLAPIYVESVLKKHEGTRLGREQIYAEMLDDDAGRLFHREWLEVVDHAPQMVRQVRFWDIAATAQKDNNDPDWTAGALVGMDANKEYCILDMALIRGTPQQVQALVRQTALRDGPAIPVYMEQEPGSAGKIVIDHYRRNVLAGFRFKGVRSTGSKADRAAPLSTMVEARHVTILKRSWTEFVLTCFDRFGEQGVDIHDDPVDAVSGGFSELSGVRPTARPASVPVSTPDQAYRQQQARYVPQPTTRRRPGIGIAFH